jgi:hypothetical protein
VTDKERRARDAALERLLDALAAKLYEQVAEAVSFTHLDSVEQSLVVELERLIAVGEMPAAPDRSAIERYAAAMIAHALIAIPGDPRRAKQADDDDDDDCELCRTLGTGPFIG